MALTKLTTELKVHQTLADRPNQTDGLTPATLKAKYDQPVEDIKSFINETLTAEIDENFTTKDEITTNRKLDSTGDFTGTINGLSPTQVDPYVSAKVEEHTSQLADIVPYNTQEDFIETLKRHMKYKGVLNILPNNITDNFNVSVLFDIGDSKAISYTFYKQLGIDDFLKLGIGRYGSLSSSDNLLEEQNMDSRIGTWITTPTYYTTVVGSQMTFDFFGSKLVFHHVTDNRGGIWKFIIDNDLNNPLTISTWNATSLDKDDIIFSDTVNKNHSIIATFMGDDPNHVPSGGAGTSRGWANFATDQYTFKVYSYNKVNTAIIETIASTSNWEWAFQIRKHGTSDPYYFVPYHTAITAYKVNEPIFLVDGTPTTLQAGISINDVKELKIIQSVYGRVPEHPGENLIKVSTITSFYGDGTIGVDGKLEVLQDIDVPLGYGAMFPLNPTFSKKLVSGIGNKYPTIIADGSSTYLSDENDKCANYLALNDSTYNYLGMAMRINNPKQSLRQGQSGKASLSQCTLIQHRVDNNQKLYPQVYKDAYLQAGHEYRFSATYFMAKFDGLYNLF